MFFLLVWSLSRFMAILLVLVEPVCSLYIYLPKVGYSDKAVDPIRQRKTAVNSLQQLQSPLNSR